MRIADIVAFIACLLWLVGWFMIAAFSAMSTWPGDQANIAAAWVQAVGVIFAVFASGATAVGVATFQERRRRSDLARARRDVEQRELSAAAVTTRLAASTARAFRENCQNASWSPTTVAANRMLLTRSAHGVAEVQLRDLPSDAARQAIGNIAVRIDALLIALTTIETALPKQPGKSAMKTSVDAILRCDRELREMRL